LNVCNILISVSVAVQTKLAKSLRDKTISNDDALRCLNFAANIENNKVVFNMFVLSRHKIMHNVLQLAEGGDFQHTLSCEALNFIYPQNCPTKHETATFGKVLCVPCMSSAHPFQCY